VNSGWKKNQSAQNVSGSGKNTQQNQFDEVQIHKNKTLTQK
jgi:hypothetical protein